MAITIDPRLNPKWVSLALLLAAGASAIVLWALRPDTVPVPSVGTPALPIAEPQPAPALPPPTAQSLSSALTSVLTPADIATVRVYGTLGNAAIVSVGDAVQQRISIGRQLLPGIVLESTAPGHIIVARGGTRLKLPLLSFDGIAPAATVVAADAAAKPDEPMKMPTLSRTAFGGDNSRRQTLAFRLGLQPEKDGKNTIGFRIRKAASMPFFTQVGLRDGDIVVTMNGNHFQSSEKVTELSDELAQSTRMVIVYIRDGETREIVATLGE